MFNHPFQQLAGIVMDGICCAKRALVAGLAVILGLFTNDRPGTPRRLLAFEPMEPRLPLSAAGLVDVGTQPDGGLAGKIAYIHAGHGYTADNLGSGAWSFQRSEVPGTEMIEDLGNQDQTTFLADYLFRAGATIVPLRPIGHQTNEIVLDNISSNVTFVGDWSNSASSIYFGNPGEIPYRYASTSSTETAYARYRPEISEAGFYPVYAWTRYGSDRAGDQLYRVHHSGGTSEVTVNHRQVGNGLVYLGTYYFETGTQGYVDISNRSSETGQVVIADMIRFGNGMGDIDRGGGISGLAREDESGLYWVMWHADRSQGVPESEYRATSNDRDAAVSFSPRYAEYMNRELDGGLSERVFVSYHSNAAGSRGVLGLYNGNNDPDTAMPNQFLLANLLGIEVNNDLVAQDGQFEHDWFNRGRNVTLDRGDIEFGEINNLRINNEFDATIVEVAFHDDQIDAELMRDPNVRDALARATYQGLIKYFRAVDGNATPATALPAPVNGVYIEAIADGSVNISWATPPTNSYAGDAPTGFRIYASANGYGFDGGTLVAGGNTTSAVLHGYDPTQPYYFKVVAVNAGGESAGSEVVTARPSAGPQQVLIVNGFDRLERRLNPLQPVPNGGGNTVERVRPRESNSRDYVVQVHSAIHEVEPRIRVESTSNEAVISGAVDLDDYHTVIWILGEESTADNTFDATEQAKVEQFVAGGGNLFLTGAEIGWDLDQQNNGRAFYENTLHADFAADDANTYTVSASGAGIFAGLPNFSFDNGSLFYDVEFPDVIAPISGAQAALGYVGGSGGNAAIQVEGTAGRGSIVMFGFPFETITSAERRRDVIDRVFDFFSLTPIPPPNADFNNDGTVDAADYVIWRKSGNYPNSPDRTLFPTDAAGYVLWRSKATANVEPGTLGDADYDGVVDEADELIWHAQFGESTEIVEPASEALQPSAVPTSVASITSQPSTINLAAAEAAIAVHAPSGAAPPAWQHRPAEAPAIGPLAATVSNNRIQLLNVVPTARRATTEIDWAGTRPQNDAVRGGFEGLLDDLFGRELTHFGLGRNDI
jgi:Fibronectin type III domain